MGTRADADFIGFSFYFFVRRNVHFCNSLFPNVAGGSQRHEYEAIKPLSGDRYGDSISKLKSCFPSEGGQNTGRVKKKKKIPRRIKSRLVVVSISGISSSTFAVLNFCEGVSISRAPSVRVDVFIAGLRTSSCCFLLITRTFNYRDTSA